MNTILCDDCNKKKAIFELDVPTYKIKKLCKTCMYYYRYHNNGKVTPIHTAIVARRNLPINIKYNLVSITEHSDCPGVCENCGKLIVNIATIDNGIRRYDVGLDCAETLSYTDNSVYFQILEQTAMLRKINAFKSDMRKLLANNTLSIFIGNCLVYVYDKKIEQKNYSYKYKISRETFDKYVDHNKYKSVISYSTT